MLKIQIFIIPPEVDQLLGVCQHSGVEFITLVDPLKVFYMNANTAFVSQIYIYKKCMYIFEIKGPGSFLI